MCSRQKDPYVAVDTPYVEIREVLQYPPNRETEQWPCVGSQEAVKQTLWEMRGLQRTNDCDDSLVILCTIVLRFLRSR